MKRIICCLFIFSFIFCQLSGAQNVIKKFLPLISKGEFLKAQIKMKEDINNNKKLSIAERLEIEFEIERLDRIRLDFKKDKKDILPYIKKYIPNVTEKDLKNWEKAKSLEYMFIDGQKKYFNNAASNLFRLDKMCLKIKEEADRKRKDIKTIEFDLISLLKNLKEESGKKNSSQVGEVKYRIDYTVILDSNVVPEGEIVRAWLPFPREVKRRQENIIIISTYPEKYILAGNDNLHRSIYFEQQAKTNKKMEFKISYQYTCYSQYNKIEAEKIKNYDTSSSEYKKYTSERPPHIVFSDELKSLSQKIVEDEKNPFLKAKKIFEWVDGYAPWASAREYSTIQNIPAYLIENKHGDCGIQTLTFMTLARMNGIPTRWQSGWEAGSAPVTMHDWCMMYLEPYGWVPVDQSYGLKKSNDEDIKWFYLGNIDNRRLIINDDYSMPFFPMKIHPRSETVDFQRGELEWRGGNIYFDKWDYFYKVSEIK